MDLRPFLLDRWIEQKHYASPQIEYDLASSTGPVWTLRELLALSSETQPYRDARRLVTVMESNC